MKTRRVLTTQEFHSLKLCGRCGIANESRKCEVCRLYRQCIACGIVLKPAVYPFYDYMFKFNGRQGTFIEKIIHHKNNYLEVSEGLCSACVGWETRIKNKCFVCGELFINNKKDYILKGNTCGPCDSFIDYKIRTELLYERQLSISRKVEESQNQ